MQISRLFEIVYILLEKKKTTANELAAYFEVSKRTILRDIETLTMAGIPIYTAKGKGGGISILDHFVLNKATISDQEQNQILFALQSLASTQNIDAGDLLSKLGALFNKRETDWIEVDFSRWGNRSPDKEKFEMLKNSILGKQLISFVYPSSYGRTTSRTVAPLKLVFKSKAWYLQGYCMDKKEYRIFKINRMLEGKVLEKSYAEQNYTPPPLEMESCEDSVLVHLKLLFLPEAAYRVYDEFEENNVQQNSDNSFTVTIDLPEDLWLYGFLLSFGSGVKVLEPESVKEALLARAKEVENLYK